MIFERRGEFAGAQDNSATMQILKQKEDMIASDELQRRHTTAQNRARWQTRGECGGHGNEHGTTERKNQKHQ
jgi:hypothetical protein